MQQVAVIIPIYKTTFSPAEELSLIQNYKQFRSYPVVVVHPDTLDVSVMKEDYPRMQFMAFPQKCFDGIRAYNSFMLEKDLYAAFLGEYEYVLICQTDAYIFRGDDLEKWCDKGYDYIGAPWIKRRCYDMPVMKQWQTFQQWRNHRRGLLRRQDFWNKVGNGGLSLRKVKTFYDGAIRYATEIEKISSGEKFVAEDIFWSTMVEGFRYPNYHEALHFAFDKDPDYCYYMTGGTLPFGCHGWFNGKVNRRFWFTVMGIIPEERGYTRYPVSKEQ